MSLPQWTLNSAISEKSTIKASIINIASGAARLFASIGTAVVLGRLLSPSDFGLVNMVMPILVFLLIFSDFGVSAFILRSDECSDHLLNRTFWFSALLISIISTAFFFLSDGIAFFYDEPQLSLIIKFLSFAVFLSIFSITQNAFVRRYHRQELYAYAEIIAATSAFVIPVYLAKNDFGYWSIVSIPIIRTLVHSVVISLISGWFPHKPDYNASVYRDIYSFSKAIIPGQIINVLAKNVDKVFVGAVFGKYVLGHYSMAVSIMILPAIQILSPTAGAIIPYFKRFLDAEHNNTGTLLTNVLTIIFGIVAPLMTFASVYSDVLIEIILGDGWTKASYFFSILAFISLIYVHDSVINWMLIATDNVKFISKWSIMNLALLLLSFFSASFFRADWFVCFYLSASLLSHLGYLLYLYKKNVVVDVVYLKYCVKAIFFLIFIYSSNLFLRYFLVNLNDEVIYSAFISFTFNLAVIATCLLLVKKTIKS